MTLAYVTTRQRDRAEIRAGRDVAAKMCERRGLHRASFQVFFGDTAPPALTFERGNRNGASVLIVDFACP
jgi:hypothetical protein